LLLELGQLAARTSLEALLAGGVCLRLRAWRSISSWVSLRSTWSISRGSESISILSLEAASSTRSMALSGRKRSVM
jgi:hypothetical protein